MVLELAAVARSGGQGIENLRSLGGRGGIENL